jgi:hypothetical protein
MRNRSTGVGAEALIWRDEVPKDGRRPGGSAWGWLKLPLLACSLSLGLKPACVAQPAPGAGPMSLAGYRALVVRPENSYYDYDSVIQAELRRRDAEVVWGEPASLADPEALKPYDLVATNIKRSFTPEQVAGLKAYLAVGGALYGSWGGPMGCAELLESCGVRQARSVYIKEITLLDSPLSKSLGECRLPFPEWVGHVRVDAATKEGVGLEMVAFDFVDGTLAARDVEGRCLGVLKEHGLGRSAVLGFGPENGKCITQDRKLADRLLDNLLAWLMPRGPRSQAATGLVEVNLPRRAKVLAVSVNGTPVEQPQLKVNGSLRTLSLPVAALGANETATVKITYEPLARTRQVETWIHNCCGEMVRGFNSPVQAADFLVSLGATVVQPLLRYDSGGTLFRSCVSGDTPNRMIAAYAGDYLAEYVDACHQRGIKVVGGLYMTWKKSAAINATTGPLLEKNGAAAQDQRACPLDAALQARNLEVVSQFLDQYPKLDGLILDDNFEFDGHPCYCAACKVRFRTYCEKNGLACADPATAPVENLEIGRAWKAFWGGEAQSFARRVRAICTTRNQPLGGWCSGGMAALRLSQVFDFLGAMVYTSPVSMVRQPLSALPEDRGYVTLLWGMNRRPADLEAEMLEAIQAGSTAVGFWIGFDACAECDDTPWRVGTKGRKPGAFELTPGSLEAIARAFARAEADWLAFYRDNVVRGDRRLAVVSGRVTREELTLTLRQTEQLAAPRQSGAVDVSALQ